MRNFSYNNIDFTFELSSNVGLENCFDCNSIKLSTLVFKRLRIYCVSSKASIQGGGAVLPKFIPLNSTPSELTFSGPTRAILSDKFCEHKLFSIRSDATLDTLQSIQRLAVNIF